MFPHSLNAHWNFKELVRDLIRNIRFLSIAITTGTKVSVRGDDHLSEYFYKKCVYDNDATLSHRCCDGYAADPVHAAYWLDNKHSARCNRRAKAHGTK